MKPELRSSGNFEEGVVEAVEGGLSSMKPELRSSGNDALLPIADVNAILNEA